MMIRGVYPGTGKSFICQKMVDKGYKVIFVCLLIGYYKNLKVTP